MSPSRSDDEERPEAVDPQAAATPEDQLRAAFLRMESKPTPERLKAVVEALSGGPRRDRRL